MAHDREFRLLNKHNTLYGFEYCKQNGSNNQIKPADLKHKKQLIHSPKPGEYALSLVFRDLKSFFDPTLKNRFLLEQSFLPMNLDWSNISEAKIKPLNLQHPPFSKPSDHPLVVLNRLEVLLPVSRWKEVIGPGDEIHPNPLASAMLGVHTAYFAGSSLSGNKDIGCCCIHLGEGDTIVDDSYVIYYLHQTTSEQLMFIGRKSMLHVSFFLQNPIAVILCSNKSYHKRTLTRSQYYLNNFYIHYFSQQDDFWYVHLRTYPRKDAVMFQEDCHCCKQI
jgi:hypothetical protein